MRKRGIARDIGEGLEAARAWADEGTRARLRLLNALAASSFVAGGSLFAIGAALALVGESALFLVAGHLAFVELSGRWYPAWQPRELGWWVVAVNQLGSVLFMVSAVASFVHSDGEMTSQAIANWGTLSGALCLAFAGVLQEFERPA